jgi:ABC-type multidrug transport system fused ATPase/permease subunit
MVTQEVQLFRASVRDNVSFFDPAVADAQILDAFDQLGLTPWLETLPNGLDTVLGAGGGTGGAAGVASGTAPPGADGAAPADAAATWEAGLSAGEAQLLAFARVFLRDPGLVLLDEATSRLDPATERLIERAVDRLMAGRTAIVIAHRLATVARADSVLVLEGGRLAEWGSRAALAADPGSRLSGLLRAGLDAPAEDATGEAPVTVGR